MAKNVQYTIGFNADTSQAKKALQELSSAFAKLEKKQLSLNYSDLDLNKAVESAKELQIELNKATNINTGKLNLNDFMSNLSQSKSSLKELSMNLISAGKEGQQAFASLANSIAQAEVPLKQTNTVLKNFGQTLKNTVKWEISSNVVHGLESALSGAVSYVKNLNSSLNDIRIVTGYSADDMTRFAQQANKAAKELSTTTKAYTDASLIYFQQGDNAEMVAKKAAITTKAANVAFSASAEEMSEMLTAVWNSYQVGEAELEKYVDIMAALGAATATSTEEIATAMQKVAATANTVGVSMEQMSSIIATVASVTREAPESIGTSFKTILARMGDLKVGKTLEDGMSLGTVSSQLAAVGVNILDTTGELKDMGGVIEELMGKWQGMTSAEKTAVAQAVAGKRQYTQLMALMENQDMYQKSMNIAGGAEGTLQKQVDIYAESWKAASDRMQASFEALYSKMINDKALISFANGISKITDSVGSLIDAFGGLPGLLATIGAVATKVFSNQINASLTKTIGNISTYFKQFSGAKDFINKIGHGKTKTTAELRDEQARNQANQIFTDLRSKVSDGSSEAYTIDSAKQLLAYKQQLVDVESQLSDAEKQSALTAMDSLSQQQQAVANLLAEKEKLLKETAQGQERGVHEVAQAMGGDSIRANREKIDAEIKENWGILKTGGREDREPIQLEEKVTSLNQLLALEQEQSRIANLAAAFNGQLKQIDTTSNASADVIKDAIQRINKALGVNIPEDSTLEEVEQQLDEIQAKSESVQNDLEELLGYSFKEGTAGRQEAFQWFNNASDKGAEQATVEFQIQANESSVEKLKAKLKEALNPKNETYSKIATGLTKAAGYAQNLASSLSTGTNLVATMSDETATLGDKIGAVAGGISSLVSGFMSGGWVGLAISAVGMLVSGLIQAQQEARKAYEESIRTKAEKSQDRVSELEQQNNAINQLLPKYGELAGTITSSAQISAEYKSAVQELTDSLGFQGDTIDGLIDRYHGLDNAITQGTISQLQTTIDDYDVAKTDLINAAALDLGNQNSGIVEYGNGKYVVNDKSLINLMHDYGTEKVYANNDNELSNIGTNKIVNELIDSYDDTLKTMVKNSYNNDGTLNLVTLYSKVYDEIQNLFTINNDSEEGLDEAGLQQAKNLVKLIQDFSGTFGAIGDNLNYENLNGPLAYLSTVLQQDSHGGFSKNYEDSVLYKDALKSNPENAFKRDKSSGLLSSVDQSSNTLKDITISNIGLSDQAKTTIEQLQSGAELTAQQLYDLYTELSNLPEEYQNLIKDNSFYQSLKSAFSSIQEQVITPMQEAEEMLTLIDNGFTITNFQMNNIDSITDLKNFIDTIYDTVDSIAEEPVDFTNFSKSAIELLKLWGLIPDITSELENEISLSASIAKRNDVSQEVVRTEMDRVRNNTTFWEGQATTPSDINWSNLIWENGGFTDDSVNAEIQRSNISAIQQKTLNEITGLKTLQGYSATQLQALGADKFEQLGVTFSKEIEGFKDVTDLKSYLNLDSDQQQAYIQRYLEILNEEYYGDGGIADQTISAFNAEAEKNLKLYEDESQSDKYKMAKIHIGEADTAKAAANKLIKNRKSLTTDEIIEQLKLIYGENWGEIISSDDIQEWTAADDIKVDSTEFMRSLFTRLQLNETNTADEREYVATTEGYLSSSYANSQRSADLQKAKDWYQMTSTSDMSSSANSIKVLTTNLDKLKTELNSLNSIDVTELPKAGTQAYEVLNKVLTKTNKSFSDYRNMSQKDRIKFISSAKKNYLNEELKIQNNIATSHADNWGFDENTKYEDVLGSKNTDKINAYREWQAALLAANQLKDDLVDNEQQTLNSLIQLGIQNTNAAIALFENEQEKLKKAAEDLLAAADILSANVDSGVLTFEEQLKIDPDVFNTWKSFNNMTDRVKFAAQQTADAYQQQMEYQQNINDGYKSAQHFMSLHANASQTKLSDSNYYSSSDVFKNMLDGLRESDATKAALVEADSKVRSTLGSNATVKDWGDAMRTELESLGDEGIDALNLLEAQGKDVLSNIFLNFSQDLRDRAEEAAAAWIQAFKDISDAKQKLLSGGSLVEDIAGNPEKLIQLANALGISVKDATRSIIDGTINADNINRPSFDLNASKAQYGLNLRSEHGVAFGTDSLSADKSAVLKMLNISEKEATDENYQEITKALRDMYTQILTDAQLTNEDDTVLSIEQIDQLVTDILNFDPEAYKKLIEATTKINDALSGSAEALEVLANDQESQLKIKKAADVNEQTTQINGQEINYNDLQKLQEAVGRAQEAKNNNQSFSELTSEDQSLLTKYGIDFTNVDTAAIDCANALVICAEAAAQLAEATAQSLGYEKNKNGNYQKVLTKEGYVASAAAQGMNGQEAETAWKSLLEDSNTEKTDDGKIFIGTEVSDVTETIQQLEEILSGLKSTSETKATENLEAMAKSVDMSKQEFIDFTQSLYNASGATKDFNNLTPELQQAMYEIARKTKNAENGFESLQKTSKETWKILKKEATSSIGEYSKALTGMKQNIAKIFNTDISKISNKFVENHLEQMEKMAEGTEEEAMAAQDAIENDLVAELLKADGIEPTVTIKINGVEQAVDILDMFQNQFDQWDGQEVGFTVDADTAPAINNMNDLLNAGTMTAEQITAALNSIGWEPNITWQDVTMVNEDAEQGTVTVQDSNGNKYTVRSENVMRTDNALKIPIIGSATKISTPGGGGRKKSSGGGGGGGGKAKKIDKKDPEDEKERYHHVNKVLERLSNQLDEVDKKKSRVYGKSYLDYISQEIALTEKQCDAYQHYIDEAKEYLALDTQRVASLGATFDEFGNIENYDQVMDNIMGKYNEFVDRYNAMSASEQEAAEEEKTKWDEWYEEKKKWIENYEETVSTIYEQQNNLLEAQNKISEKTLEGIQYKVEIHVDMTEAEKDFLDYLNDTYDELLEKQGDVMNNLVRETELATSNLDALGRSKEELDAAFASGKLNQADYVEGLKDVNEQILDNLSNIQDLKKEIEELYGNTLEMASDAFDEQTEKVKNASEAMSSYISILGLIGKGSNLKDLTKFYESQYEYNLQSLEMQKEYLDILRSEEQYYLERMNSAEGLTETERQQYEDLEKTIADVNSNILSDTESTLNQIAEAFNNEIEIIFKDLEERIAGVGNSVQDLADAYSYYQEEQSRYVTSARELYEVNKLNRQIEKTMNETSSKVNKNLLAALQDRINKQSELNELTEYDIEMNQLQYELLLKKIALEEAQNAKSTVRLTRDSGGNYIYQYTADQDDIMTKQQEYEDVLQKINDLAVNRVQDLESQLLEIYQNTLSKIKEIAQDQTLTEEEKYDKIQTVMNQFKEQTNFIQEQYQIASDNLITSNLAISEHYGQQLVEHSENAKNGLNQTIAAMIEDTEGLQQALENACANQIPAAMDTMQSRINAVTTAVNLDYNSMSDSVTNYNKVTKDAQDQTSKTANSLNKDLLPAIHSATTAWDTYMGKLKNVISTYESMYQSILKTIQAQAKLSNATAPSTVKSSGTGKFSDTTTPSAGGKTDTSSGGGGGNGGSTGGTRTGTAYTTITYKVLTTSGPAQGKAVGGSPLGPKKLAVGTSGTFSHNPSPGFAIGGQSISDPSKLSISGGTITALAAGSVVVTVQYWDRRSASTPIGGGGGGLKNQVMLKYATGGLADFTGPAWLDGSKSRPEMVLNAKDTANILTAVQGVRALDASTLSMLNKYITNASLAMSFGLGNISAGSVYGATDTIQQEVHITAEFPNATNSAEIQDAFDNIINRATQYITTKR